MSWFEDEHKIVRVKEMLEQAEDIYTELRLEYLEMVKSYDDAMDRITELEADKVYLEELLDDAVEGRRR